MKKYIAIDIGASSGRLILGELKNKQLLLSEIHRFENGSIKLDGHLRWDIRTLFNEILIGLKKISKMNIQIKSIGIDTWAVDYVLMDKNDDLLELPITYRDNRTNGVMEEVLKKISKKELYKKTGIQFLEFNTIYQLYSVIITKGNISNSAVNLLMIPDYLNFLLSGKKSIEYTNATSTQLVNKDTKNWDKEILEKLNINKDILPNIVMPGSILGKLNSKIKDNTGLEDIKIIAPATHDTASAVASVPASGEEWAFISSGTWSLMGMESKTAITSKKALDYNFTNEGGVNNTFRILKNIMGLWIVSELKKELNPKESFSEIVKMAEESKANNYFINANDSRLLNPNSMVNAFKEYFLETSQNIPKLSGEYYRAAFEGLANCYLEVLEQLREIQNKEIKKIHIIGGGCKNKFLCQLTANLTKLPVYAGPVEGTAIGNLIIQSITLGDIESLKKARKIIKNSIEIIEYLPQ